MNSLQAMGPGFDSHFVGARFAAAECARPAKISTSKEFVRE
jgi:hypothetical protein